MGEHTPLGSDGLWTSLVDDAIEVRNEDGGLVAVFYNETNPEFIRGFVGGYSTGKLDGRREYNPEIDKLTLGELVDKKLARMLRDIDENISASAYKPDPGRRG